MGGGKGEIIPEGSGGMPPNVWSTTFFPRDFHTPNIRTGVKKWNKSIYYTNEFEHLQHEKCQLG